MKNLVLLELFPVVVALELWGTVFSNKKVCLHCDNLGVVQVINSLPGDSCAAVSGLGGSSSQCLLVSCPYSWGGEYGS